MLFTSQMSAKQLWEIIGKWNESDKRVYYLEQQFKEHFMSNAKIGER